MNAMTLIAQNAGFLPTRGSIMIDFVFLAMFGIILILGTSIYLVRYRRMFEVHKWIQVVTGVVLLLAVLAFEIDMRFFTDWQALAEPSSYGMGTVKGLLYFHLLFAIPTPLLWIFVIWHGLAKFPNPAAPSPYSNTHIFWARLAAIGMLLTAVTGWVFYYAAFVA
ncbi:DUF420 domain-containing protein [Bremerella cremea]|uniref:DUF420 domain-containing protein n=1 Tax=Blastopirellula marina TaxID=124 RepID=A0A2S8FRP7_9BACT|nr:MULTISPECIES: DUF420 domain-containing protein [Pirellulaceae]PQO34524.1 DUF420 domain-containing protein [Blastopirellula marina]RCS47020.1 DUF420 domain-containing protein [Bremerella cremea]